MAFKLTGKPCAHFLELYHFMRVQILRFNSPRGVSERDMQFMIIILCKMTAFAS